MQSTYDLHRFRPTLSELEAIASVELAEPLAAVRANALTSTDASRLAAYVRSELEANGLLTAEHHLIAGNAGTRRKARSLESNARAFLRAMERRIPPTGDGFDASGISD